MTLRFYLLAFLLLFGLTPLVLAVAINLPLVLERTTLFYQRAYLQNLRADFRDLDQHLASRHEMIRLLARLADPTLMLDGGEVGEEVDAARARHSRWINQILFDQGDIIQLLYLDPQGEARFWLGRDARTQGWEPMPEPPRQPNPGLLRAGLDLQPGAVMVSRIRIDPRAGGEDPRRLMTLELLSRIGGEAPHGLVVMTLDVGGLAQFYRETLWVNHDGSYLRPGQPGGGEPEAFEDFPGLADIFAAGNLAVWKGAHGEQLLWVPMFLTEDGVPLWVGRAVDPSPIDAFRNALMLRVFSIILVLVVVLLMVARFIATRLERLGKELSEGLARILGEGRALRFDWRGPREIRQLGAQLTALAETHAEHLRAARAQTRELERSNRYKSQFLANVSHELRTPLNSILLLSKMLAADAALDASRRRQAQVIHEAGSDLRTMIDNILDISRIEAGQVAIAPETLELRPLLQGLLEQVEPQLAEKPVRLEFSIDPRAPGQITTDAESLRHILRNLLANAVKFTERGRVSLRVEPGEAPEHPLAIRVEDSGIGIPLDKQSIIFEAFQQADGSTRRRYGGTGLGLSISRELAGLIGARIEVESAPGSGSRFSLLLPPAPPGTGAERPSALQSPSPQTSDGPAQEAPEAVRPMLDGWVLIVEREVASLARLAAALAELGLRAQSAADLDEALEVLGEEGEACRLILVAERLLIPEACDRIGQLLMQHPQRASALVVLADSCAERGRWIEAGAADCLSPPIGVEVLHALLARLEPASLPRPPSS